MLYPNLQINISKKRGAGGLDENAQVINTPVILDYAVAMCEEKNSFAFNPTLFKQEKHDEKHNSLETPILDFNQTPFFNRTPSATGVSPGDDLNNFVAPNDILNPYTTASSTSTSTSTNINLPINTSSTYNLINILESNEHHHQLNIPNKLLASAKQQQDTSIHQSQNDHHFTIASTAYNTSNQQQQLNQYASNILNNQQQTDLNDNLTALNSHYHLTASTNQDQLHSLTYTELKPSNQQQQQLSQQQQLLIPNSVFDVSDNFNNKKPPPSYVSVASPASSLSSQASSNLDNQDNLYSNQYGESSTSHLVNRSTKRFHPGQSSSSNQSNDPKKPRQTKKQKYDAMISEEKKLLEDNETLKNDIRQLEVLIQSYKQTIMNTVKNNK